MVADQPQHQPPTRGAQPPVQYECQRCADEEQHVDVQRRTHAFLIAPGTQGQRRQHGRLWLDKRFTEKERQPGAEQDQRDAERDVVDPR